MLKPPQADTDMKYWDLEMTVEEPLSDDNDGVPRGVSDFESEFNKDSDKFFASCDTEGICFFFNTTGSPCILSNCQIRLTVWKIFIVGVKTRAPSRRSLNVPSWVD
jgi:hypothetical protein